MEIYSDILDETIIHGRLKNGLNYYIIPKNMYNEKRALISVKYGSVDSVFKIGGQIYESPPGVAHFLEHKLFDNEHGSAFDSFSRLGAYVNAYTSFNNTSYYFSCESGFLKSLETLLGFVSEPYFTEASVQKEIGIISQEISMYDDTPAWASYFNMLSLLYENHPAKNNIAGTKETISGITRDMLYNCYESFYVPSNMYLICVGDFSENEKESITQIAEKYWANSGIRAETIIPDERVGVRCAESVVEADISRPIFQIGLKDASLGEQVKKPVLYKLMLDLLIGESSYIRQQLVNKGLSDDSLSFDYISGDGYGYGVISGESSDPRKLLDMCVCEAAEICAKGFNEEDFDRIRKKHTGRFIRGFNSIEAITMASAELAVKGANLFDCLSGCEQAEINNCNELIKESFRKDAIAMSLLIPKGE